MMRKTHNRILEAGFRVFAATPTATLQDVADEAGIGRATLHRHFKGREELMAALALTAMKELDTAIEAATQDASSHTEALRRSLDAMIPLADRQMFLANEPLDHVPEVLAAYTQQLDELAEAIEAAKDEGGFDRAVPTAWIVQAYETLTYAAWAVVRDGNVTATEAAELMWRTLQSGLSGGQS
ncbi:TetR/AcrR family transcriptional regulator [Shimia sp. R11_0]|uniref:Transcriptional repressor BetI n=1 Tax=Shimia marina TaxID=321267 RepID=A0A0P1EN00_9RHOB|nr:MULTISPECIES: TetR/AcrR family transcriptional regulator [Shimia]MBO9476016.1 TetR/AcrR family transcriptional regulator [Shimia sp. R11_0]CUH51594.1 transcriptional repressor BetI [Shimia marina]SFD45131.1 transcriptional regulator, TetR family [Shimia marina]